MFNEKIQKTIEEISENGPTRIVINFDGEGVHPLRVPGIKADIIFIRNDGWSCGAPSQYEKVAYNLWKGTWVAFIREGEEAKDISEYGE